jgi:hypothetical protein
LQVEMLAQKQESFPDEKLNMEAVKLLEGTS